MEDASAPLRGRLEGRAAAPASGEVVRRLLAVRNLVVEEILSGRLDRPVDYVQDEDEWVALLEGRARLEVEGRTLELGPGDWLFLPSGLRHTLLETEPGTTWLAVHLHRD
jgi:cupin 2 domain-containing protein